MEQLGLVGTIRDEDQSPEEPDTESDPEVSVTGHIVHSVPRETARSGGCR